jgi:hypothetical protein
MRVCFNGFSDRMFLIYLKEELIHKYKLNKDGEAITRLDNIIAQTSHNTCNTMGRS